MEDLAWLQARDLMVLRFIHDWECAGREQLEEIFFGSERTANRRLLKMVRAGLLERLPAIRVNPANKQKIPPVAYVITPFGAQVRNVGDDLRLTSRKLRGETTFQHALAPHAIDTVRFLITLQDAVAGGDKSVVLSECRGPRQLKRDIALLRGKASLGRNSVPDAFIAYDSGRLTTGFWIEMDRGSEGRDVLSAKFEGYKTWFSFPETWNCFARNRYLNREGKLAAIFPFVLMITSGGDARLKNLVAQAQGRTGAVKWLFTNWERIEKIGVLGKIWYRLPEEAMTFEEVSHLH